MMKLKVQKIQKIEAIIPFRIPPHVADRLRNICEQNVEEKVWM